MNTNNSPADFQSRCHELFTCFTFATFGLELVADTFIPRLTGDPDQTFYIGSGHPDEGRAHSEMKMPVAVAHSEKNGAFTDIFAKALIVLMYTEWDELYRHNMAQELGVKASDLKSDLMGDLRHIRNWIVHNKSRVDAKCKAIKLLPWSLSEDEVLNINKEQMAQLMDHINSMQVRVNDAQPSVQGDVPASAASPLRPGRA